MNVCMYVCIYIVVLDTEPLESNIPVCAVMQNSFRQGPSTSVVNVCIFLDAVFRNVNPGLCGRVVMLLARIPAAICSCSVPGVISLFLFELVHVYMLFVVVAIMTQL